MTSVLRKMSTILCAQANHAINVLTSNKFNFTIAKPNENAPLATGHKKTNSGENANRENISSGNLQQEDFYKSSRKTYEMPREFFNDEFIDDPIMMRLFRYILSRTASEPCVNTFRSNGFHSIKLQKHEFIFGRQNCVDETGLSAKQVRERIERLRELGLIELKQVFPSYSLYHIVKKDLSDVVHNSENKRASSFSAHALCEQETGKKEGQQKGQLLSDVPKPKIVSEKPKVMNNFPSSKTSKKGQQLSEPPQKRASSFCPQEPMSRQSATQKGPAVFSAQQSCSFVQRKETSKEKKVYGTPDEKFVVKLSPLHKAKEENTMPSQADQQFVLATGLLELRGLEHAIKPYWIKRWLQEHGFDKFLKTLKQLDEQKNPVKNIGGWMQNALRKGYAEKSDNISENMQFIQNFIEENKIDFLKITKKYCMDMNNGNDYQFNLHPESFKDMIIKKYAHQWV